MPIAYLAWRAEKIEAARSRPQREIANTNKLYRIEILHPDGHTTGCADHCDATLLPVPNWPGHKKPFQKGDKFWFTERGWIEHGEDLYKHLSYRNYLPEGQRATLLQRQADLLTGEKMTYSDAWQVTIRPANKDGFRFKYVGFVGIYREYSDPRGWEIITPEKTTITRGLKTQAEARRFIAELACRHQAD